jgi:diguanylate cyclase (GGDEF)-like protein
VNYRPTRKTRRDRRRPLAYPIGLLLAILAAVPLAGAGWFAIGHVRDASSERQQAASLGTSVERLVLLTELRTRLLDERNWFSTQGGIEEIGLNTAFVFALTGNDVPAQLERSAQEVDDLIVELELDDVAREVAVIRSIEDDSLAAIGLRYHEVEAELFIESEDTVDHLLESAGTLGEADQLITALRVLRASTMARQAISDEFTEFFGAEFSPADQDATRVDGVIALRALRFGAEDDILRLAEEGSHTHAAFRKISTDTSVETFNDAVVTMVENQLEPSDMSTTSDLDSVLDDLDGAANIFSASSAATEIYFELVDAAGRDTLEASRELSSGAQQKQNQAMVMLVALGTVSLGLGLAATNVIRRPIRLLAGVASQISAGDSTARFAGAGGSIEIRAAGKALDEAAEHLQLAEQQTKALAEGDLDHPVLSQTNTGELGAALQHAVQALALSMQEREEFRRRMTHEATHDGLTGIANRNAALAQLNRGLARSRRSGSSLAVLFVDLDNFKGINDNHGHRSGDTVLRTIAQRMVNGVRDGDHVGRLGGDEFVVIVEPVYGVDEALTLAERLLETLTEPIKVDGAFVMVGASIGVSVESGSDLPGTRQPDGSELLRDADLAVYKAKNGGRGRIEFCDATLRAEMFERADLDQALRQAIDEHEFTLHYQPIIKPADSSLHGYEALIRWNRPDHGMVPPDDFIPFAERSDLIIMIDQWVVGAVARQIRLWDAAGLYQDVPVSINISGRHLAAPEFLTNVMTPLTDLEIDLGRIIIEITESALLDDLNGAASKLQTLRTNGIRTAIDDFGTGYTSLAHLKSLPFDILKIDRSFTNDESAASLVKLIIDTGHLLGATVTAEGIETTAQAHALTRMGSDDLQGYLYGRPLPPEDLTMGTASLTVKAFSADD